MPAIVLANTENMPYEEWLEWRRKGIGGSDVAAVCGVSKYKSPVELWQEKTGQVAPAEAGEAAYWGRTLESVVRTEFTKRTGIEVKTPNKLLQSREHPFMLANLDGVCKHPSLGTCVFEAKTSNAYMADEWDESIPEAYQLQIQHYMAVTGFPGTYIAVLIGGNTFKWDFIERDEGLIAKLIQWEKDFWEHVQSDIPPPLDGSEASANYLKKRFPNSVARSTVKLPDTALELIQLYDEAKGKGDAFIEQKNRAENLLKEMLGEHEVGIVKDRVITWKTVNQERLDGKTLKAEQPTVYEQYVNQTSHRRFSIKAAS